MSIHPESQPLLKRYLTLIYSFTLGLGLVLAILAGLEQRVAAPAIAKVTQTGEIVQTLSPTSYTTPQQNSSLPTPLPTMPPTPNQKTPSTLGVTLAELHGLQVSLWQPWTGDTGAALQDIIDEFNRTNQWGITVETSAYEGFGRLDEAVEAAMGSGLLPDVLIDYGYQAQHWDESNLVTDLTPYLDDPIWGLTDKEQSDFYPAFWAEDLVMDSGPGVTRRLGIPFYRSAYVLFYNQSWAKELGYASPPSTAQDFQAQACAAANSVAELKDKSFLGQGGWLITPQPGALIGWIDAFGGEITNPDGSGYYFNTPETQHTFEYLKDLQVSGCAWSDTSVDALTEFASRRALFVVGSLFDIPAQQEAFTKAGSPDEWMVIPFPSTIQPVVDTYGPSLLTIQSTPARQLAAWLVIKWLTYPPNLAKWVGMLETYPTRQTSLNYLNEAVRSNPQWEEAIQLLPDARSEPSMVSWSVARWALNDVSAQLFDLKFSAQQIPDLLKNLDDVAEQIFTQVR